MLEHTIRRRAWNRVSLLITASGETPMIRHSPLTVLSNYCDYIGWTSHRLLRCVMTMSGWLGGDCHIPGHDVLMVTIR